VDQSDAAHVALLHVPFHASGRRWTRFAGVAALGHFEIVVEAVAVVGMGAVVDDQLRRSLGSLPRRSATPCFGHDNLDGMFAVIRMADQWHNRADLAALGGGRAGEDRDVGVAGEIAGGRRCHS